MLERDLKVAHNWSETCFFKFHQNKCRAMHVGTKNGRDNNCEYILAEGIALSTVEDKKRYWSVSRQ